MQTEAFFNQLNDFIVQAKAATYVGSGQRTSASRSGSHDLTFKDGSFHISTAILVGLISSVRRWFITKIIPSGR